MRKRFIIPINEHVYEKVTGTIQNTLTKKEKDRKSIVRMVLAAEDVLKKLLDNRDEGTENVTLLIVRFMGSIRVTLSCPGQEFELFSNREIGWDDLEVEDEMGEKSRKALREILVDSYSQNLQYRHAKGVNTVVIRGKENEYKVAYLTAICLLCGILFGFVMKFLMGDAFAAGLQEYFLTPVRMMFLNALKILVGPVVFFSMVCCIAGCGNLSDIGKIGIRVMAMYLLTTVIAVCLGFGLFHIFPAGDPSLLDKSGGALGAAMDEEEMEEMTEAIETAEGGVSVTDTIVGIIPDNVMTPFRENNLLQLIFLGIFIGAGISVLISILLLSLGAPSMAGADLAIIVVLLSQIGIPATAIALIMGIDTLLDMMQAMCNTTSDAAVALIVAKRSGELNTEMYV